MSRISWSVRPGVLEDDVQPQGRRSAGSWTKKAEHALDPRSWARNSRTRLQVRNRNSPTSDEPDATPASTWESPRSLQAAWHHVQVQAATLPPYCQSRANAGQTVRSPQAQDHNRGEKRWNASEGDHPRHREPFPISPRIRQDPQGQHSRSAPLQSNQARKYRIPLQGHDIVHPISPTQFIAPTQSSKSTLH